jgi:hypothetical protein
MPRKSFKQISAGLFVALLLITVPAYAVKTYKTSNLGGGHQIWFEAEDFDERNPESDQYFPVVDQTGAFGRAVSRAGDAGGMIRWTFNISKADGTAGTWYFWGRVINPSNSSDFMIVEGNPGDPTLPAGPPYPGTSSAPGFANSHRIFEEDTGPSWGWARAGHEEAHTKQLRDGENTMYIVHRQGNNTVFWDVFVWTDSASYVPTDADYQNAVIGGPETAATKPDPKDGAVLESTWVTLSWTPGETAASHDIYFGESLDDVNNGTAGTFRVNQPAPSAQFFVGLGLPGDPYPAGLVPGTTYYWRVDEVNPADPNSPWKGPVWSFSILPVKAHKPSPANGAKYQDLGVILKWTPGLGAKLHYVYFGDNLGTVTNATTGTPAGVATFTPPGPLAKGKTYYWRVDEFDGATTHKGDVWSLTTLPDIPVSNPDLAGWWTLDEGEGTTAVDWSGRGKHGTFQGDPLWVDGLDGASLEFDGDDYVDTGNTQDLAKWTIACWVISPAAPANASPSGPLHREKNYQFDWNHTDAVFRGAAAMEIGGTWHAASFMPVAANTWYHLAATFDGTSLKAYRDGVLITTNTAASGVPTVETGTLKLGRHATAAQFFTGTVDDARVYNKALTADEIQKVMRGNLTRAWKPSPANGSTLDVVRAATLSWAQGDKASQHAVYLGTARNAVVNADASDTTGVYRGLQSATSYSPPDIAWAGGPYYWRVDEHNTDGTITKGTIWSFSVADHLIVDNFESYTDNDKANEAIWQIWIDGFSTPTTNGAIVGNNLPPYAEQTIVHGGRQSMPVSYNNAATAKNSEAALPLTAQRDWTVQGVTALSLWYHAEPGNAAERMYVAISNRTGTPAVVYNNALQPTTIDVWRRWNIPLQAFADQGINLKDVDRIAIGFGTKGGTAPGGTGKMYIDDIGLYRSVPPASEEIVLEAEATTSITAPLTVRNDALASGGKCIGTDAGIGNESANPPATGVATYSITVKGGVYRLAGRVIIPDGDSFWLRIPDATTQTVNHASGWVRWSDPANGDTWHWENVFSAEDAGQTVQFTLAAGTHTLEIARREDGALLDAILITTDVE